MRQQQTTTFFSLKESDCQIFFADIFAARRSFGSSLNDFRASIFRADFNYRKRFFGNGRRFGIRFVFNGRKNGKHIHHVSAEFNVIRRIDNLVRGIKQVNLSIFVIFNGAVQNVKAGRIFGGFNLVVKTRIIGALKIVLVSFFINIGNDFAVMFGILAEDFGVDIVVVAMGFFGQLIVFFYVLNLWLRQ